MHDSEPSQVTLLLLDIDSHYIDLVDNAETSEKVIRYRQGLVT